MERKVKWGKDSVNIKEKMMMMMMRRRRRTIQILENDMLVGATYNVNIGLVIIILEEDAILA